MTGPAERARLAELARAATPGRWVVVPENEEFHAYIKSEEGEIGFGASDAAYIAAANPTVILALLARLAALEAVASAAQDSLTPQFAPDLTMLRLRAALRALDGTEGQ